MKKLRLDSHALKDLASISVPIDCNPTLCLDAQNDSELLAHCLDWRYRDHWASQWKLITGVELPKHDAIVPFYQCAGLVLFNHGIAVDDPTIIACAAKPPYACFIAIRHLAVQLIKQKKFISAAKIADACAATQHCAGYLLLADVYYQYGRNLESAVETSAIQFYQMALQYVYTALHIEQKDRALLTAAYLGTEICTFSGHRFNHVADLLTAFQHSMQMQHITLNDELAQQQATAISESIITEYYTTTEGKRRLFSTISV